MTEGRVHQVGAPRELYGCPVNVGLAKFLGNNNLSRAMRLTSSNDPVPKFKTIEGGHTLMVSAGHEELMSLPVNKPCILAIRPEAITLNDKQVIDNQLAARIEHIEFGGAMTTLTLDANGLKLEVLLLGTGEFGPGEQCVVSLPIDRIRLLPTT